MNDVFCSPDVSIFVCKMLGENLLLAKWKLSIWKSKKIHIPNMSLSCDIYRWQVYKKAITKFCYKDNFLCLSVFSNCAYFIAGCMRSLAFFSLPHFPSSKTALLIPFLQENRKIVLVAHLASMLCYIFSLFIPYLCSRPKRALKEVARLWNFLDLSDKTLEWIFLQKDPKKLIWFSDFRPGSNNLLYSQLFSIPPCFMWKYTQ